MINIVSLVSRATVSEGAWSCIASAKKLFLQSDKHPCAAAVLAAGYAYTPMDDLYESAEDFDALHKAVAERLVSAGDCTYVMTGSLSAPQLFAIQSAASARGVEAAVLPGVTLSQAAFPERPAGRTVSAHGLPERLDAHLSTAVEEIDSRLAAGEAKLLLSEYYPDEWPVRLARLLPDGAFSQISIPLCELDRQASYDASTVVFAPAAGLMDLMRCGVDDLLAVMKRLRGRGGCPWDREQTHSSLKMPLLEECYELLDAIDEGSDAHMVEELGDVLLQVAFHATIAAEQGRFTDRDVATGIVKKLIYRHPHIFGTGKADTPDEVMTNWDKLKKAEKHQSTQTEVLRAVPRNLPALIRSKKVQKKAADVGFDWPSAEAAFFKIPEETEEVRRAMNGGGDVPEEIGDLLFAVVNVARLMHLDPELLLLNATDKFIERFCLMEALAENDKKQLSDMTLAEMDELWERAKNPRVLGKSSQNNACVSQETLIQ